MNLKDFDKKVKEKYPNIINITDVCIINDLENEIKNISKNIITESVLDIDYIFSKNYNMVYDFVLDLHNEFYNKVKEISIEMFNCSNNTRIIGVIILREFVENIISKMRKKLRNDWKFQREGTDEIAFDLIEMLEDIIIGNYDVKQKPTRKRMGGKLV